MNIRALLHLGPSKGQRRLSPLSWHLLQSWAFLLLQALALHEGWARGRDPSPPASGPHSCSGCRVSLAHIWILIRRPGPVSGAVNPVIWTKLGAAQGQKDWQDSESLGHRTPHLLWGGHLDGLLGEVVEGAHTGCVGGSRPNQEAITPVYGGQ